MPNWVYNEISVEKKYAEKLKTIIKNGGICQHYKPMPKALEISRFDTQNEWKENKEYDNQVEANKKNYGFPDWYEWKVNEWGTKWGECEPKEEESGDMFYYRYMTAWGPISEELIQMLAKDIPDFSYDLEEEQGWGQAWTCDNGELTLDMEWDIPDWERCIEGDNEAHDIVYLKEDYNCLRGNFKSGYYKDWDLESYLGDTLEEAKAELKNPTS